MDDRNQGSCAARGVGSRGLTVSQLRGILRAFAGLSLLPESGSPIVGVHPRPGPQSRMAYMAGEGLAGGNWPAGTRLRSVGRGDASDFRHREGGK